MRAIRPNSLWVCVLIVAAQTFAANTTSTPATTQPVPGHPACRYDIAATLDDDLASITAIARVTYRNTGRDALDELVFHFKQDAAGNGSALPRPAVRYLGTSAGEQHIDKPLRISRFTNTGAGIKDHFAVRLPHPIQPGHSVLLEIQSRSPIGGMNGMKRIEGCWHPRIAGRDGTNWLEGIDAFADYRVTVGPLPSPVIPISGSIVEQSRNGSSRWTITAESADIPDFAMVFSKADRHVSSTQDGLTIHCFYNQDRQKDLAERMLGQARDIVDFYRKTYGFYPDKVLNLILFDSDSRGYGGVAVGSNIVFVINTFDRSEDDTVWAIAHEIAHQYWGWNQVIDAQPGFSWLCLGMGLWTDRQYMDSIKKTGQHGNLLHEYMDAAKDGRNTQLLGVTDQDRKHRLDANPLAHGKGYQVILELEYLLGTDTVIAIACKTLERYAHKPISARGFQAICQEITGEDLEWFFHEWLYTNDHVDYAVKNVLQPQDDRDRPIAVSIEPKGGIHMPVDVTMEYEDGSRNTRRLPRDQGECTFAASQPWRRMIVDAQNRLPDVNRANNVKINPTVPPAFEILDVDLGEKAWGLNLLKVHVRNRTDHERTLFLHIGGRVGRPGFGQGKAHPLAAREDKWIEHWYWVPPAHGTGSFAVTFTDPTGGPDPGDDPPLLRKTYSVSFPVPNDRCNDLVISHKLPRPRYRDVQSIEPLKYLVTEHFVFYSSPGTPAYKDRAALAKEHEAALTKACEFLGVRPQDKIVMFYYPDQVTKQMCTGHTGDGYAEGNTIVEVYNKDVHLDPLHEITHLVAGQIGDPSALFCEGLAVWMQKGHAWQGQPVDDTARELMRDGRLVPLAKLLERTEIGARNDDGKVTYPQSASFVGFLIDIYGKERFLQAYKVLRNSNDPQETKQSVSRMYEIFGMSLEEMEKIWKASLLRAEAEEQSPPEG